MKIVVLDGYGMNPGDLSWDELKSLGEVVVYDRTDSNDIIARAADADAVLVNKVVLDEKTLKSLPKLKYVGVLATGYNVVDVAAAAEYGVTVTNIPAYSTDSVVQMTFAHILNITNRVAHYARLNREGRWSSNKDFCYWDTPLPELSGLTLGIVGLGNIGMKVANIARNFGMEVYADTILTLHCPLNDKTRELVNAETIARMRHGAIIINTGRGPLVNEADVAEALKSGQLSAYGADVMCQEPPRKDNPLLSRSNAFITPHVAWATFDARQRLMRIAVDNVRAFIGGTPKNVVS